ncbi:MAG: molecular chaperone [Cyanobacteria bacterium P01_F01_bin.143]
MNEPQQQSDKSQKTGQKYPGWFAIDFGTSNSTVTLHDIKKIRHQEDLAIEQKQALRDELAKWFDILAYEKIDRVNNQEWKNFLEKISKKLEINPNELSEFIANGDILKFVAEMENSLPPNQQLRRAVRKKLYEIYTEVFRIPLLRSRNFFPVNLELIRKKAEIASELEIKDLDNPLSIIMGSRAKQERNDAIAKAKEDSKSLEDIQGRFHHSPKRYFGQEREFKVKLGDSNQAETITSNDLITSAYHHLIDLTEKYHQANAKQFGQGDLYQTTAVVTYPTVASPLVRRELETIIQSLGVADVQTAYDEAVSVAIFFLWREFGGNLNLGIESFKTRCYRDDDTWVQNVLVIDIGGGTTDIALIELRLKEIPQSEIFEPDEDKGAGGRYYILTPKVLGSSGHLQLGGELITLRIFLWLKVAIADSLLTAVQEGSLKSEPLKNKISQINERFLDDNGDFQKNSLLKCLDKEYPELDQAYQDVLETAERIIPTKWKAHPERLQAFYTLWDYAEEAKIKLGQEPTDSLVNFELPGAKISKILDDQSDIKDSLKESDSIKIILNQKHFEKLTKPIIQEAFNVAKGLMENRLGDRPKHQKLDWLILSGKTCNLNQVKEETYQVFSQSKHFVWNQEKITFVPEYTKIATSAGACYAEMLSQRIFSPRDSIELLRKGASQLYIDVKNLSYYLPCSFKLLTQTLGDEILLFKAGQKLSQLSPKEPLVKARSDWRGIQLNTGIFRQDFEEQAELPNWGNFDGKAIASKLNMNQFQFRQQIKAQFQIDQKLQFQLFFCRGNPHYSIDSNIAAINVKTAIQQESTSSTLEWVSVEDNKKIPPKNGDIAVIVAEVYAVDATNAYTTLFKSKEDDSQYTYPEIFHYQDEGKQVRGIISETLPAFPKSGEHSFYLFQTDGDKDESYWILIGQLSKPDDDSGLPCKYHATLDEAGDLRIHAGEVPYYIHTNSECLKEEGWVYVTTPQLQLNELEKSRDPFSGEH